MGDLFQINSQKLYPLNIIMPRMNDTFNLILLKFYSLTEPESSGKAPVVSIKSMSIRLENCGPPVEDDGQWKIKSY